MLRDVAARVFLKPVGSPSGRLINPSGRALPHKHETGCASQVVKPYRPAVRTLHTEKTETEKNLHKLFFLKSALEHACIIN
jgi:hypothetical protein